MIRKIKSICLLILVFDFCYCQTESVDKYGVGFKYFKAIDNSRKYFIDNDTVNRPMLIHFWYPSQDNSELKQMSFKDYIDLIAIREDFKKDKQDINDITDNFINAYLGFSKRKFGIDTSITTDVVLNSPVKAIHNAIPINDKFPLIIYAPSNSKSAVQNHIICENLASNGFFVISVGSAGDETLKRDDEIKATLAQVDDMEFIVKYINDSLSLDYSDIGLIGFSSGSMATIIYQMRTPQVKAIVSLDGSHEYSSYFSLIKIDGFDLEKANTPYLMFANNYKDFSIYPYYSSIASTNKNLYKMPFLDHNGFISYWKQFDMCSKEKQENFVTESYDALCKQIKVFFDVTLKSNQLNSKEFEILSSQLIHKDSVDYIIISDLLNNILKNGIENSISKIKSNENLYEDKDDMMNILGRMFIGVDQQIALKIFVINSEINPDSWESYYNLAYLYKDSNDIDSALASIKKAKGINANNNDIQTLYDEIMKLNSE